ncbi:hypothetical protein HCN44_001748 [Aphidius gifuensis]|uniref:C2H2-type domain-containing protein n=2 Tax=Aphidius gifuensis TaxID=684658 RepID=A0A834XTX2_APHGI|nr:hypothetical protein HCN44_001748 [Aphidius gifuensis]
MEDIEHFLEMIGTGTRSIDDPLFDDSHKFCKVFQRTGVTIEDDEDLCHPVMKEFPCNVSGCSAVFHTLVDFEIHYNGAHRFTCLECGKIKSNARLLEIHIQELHNCFFKLLAEKKPMYQCFVSECEELFLNPNQRKEHCKKIHKFPKNYRYDETSRYQKQKQSKIDNKKKLDNSMEIDEPKMNIKNNITKETRIKLDKNQRAKTFIPKMKNTTNVSQVVDDNNITNNVMIEKPIINKSLVFIPRQLTQKSYSKLLTKNKKMERNVLETDNMMELADALPS